MEMNDKIMKLLESKSFDDKALGLNLLFKNENEVEEFIINPIFKLPEGLDFTFDKSKVYRSDYRGRVYLSSFSYNIFRKEKVINL